MKWLLRLIGTFLANAIGLIAAAKFISGFELAMNPKDILFVALILTLFNIFLKPILKVILGPVILLTLGLGLIIVNAIILYVLDIAVGGLTILTIPALLTATVLISLVNFIFHRII